MEEEREMTVTERIMLETDDIYTGSPSAEQEISDAQLHVEPWNRTTIADGLWLQENAIAPFSARDIMLANEIDKTNERVSELEENTTDGREVRSFTPRVWSGDDTSWRNIHDTRVIPDDELIPKNSLMYMPVIYSSSTVGDTSEGGVLSMNSKNKSFQLGISEAGLWWDFGDPNNTTTTVNGDYGSFKVDTKSGKTPMKIYSEFDKPKDNTVKVFTSGGFETLSGDGLTVEIFKNGNTHVVSARNYPGWLKTVNGEIYIPEIDEESYIHGGGFGLYGDIKKSTVIGTNGALSGNTEWANIMIHSANISADVVDSYASLRSIETGSVTDASLKIKRSFASIEGTNISRDNAVEQSFVNMKSCGVLDPSANISKSMLIANSFIPHDLNIDQSMLSLESTTFGTRTNISRSIISTSSCSLSGDFKNDIIVGDNNYVGEHGTTHDQVILNSNHSTFKNGLKNVIGVGENLNFGNTYSASNAILVGNYITPYYNVDTAVVVGDYIQYGVHNSDYPVSANCIIGRNMGFDGVGNLAISLGNQISRFVNVKGQYLNVFGEDNQVYGSKYGYSVGCNYVNGRMNNVDGGYTITLGYGNSTFGQHSLVLGDNNFVSTYGDYSITLGENNIQGYNATHGIIAGNGNTAWSERAYIFGDNNKAGGSQAMVLGDGNDVQPSAGLFVGFGNYGSKKSILAVGDGNCVYGDESFALGLNNIISNPRCFVQGEGNTTSRDGQIILGNYALSLQDSILEIGCGINGSKKTLFRIDEAGNVWCAGVLHCQSVTQHNTYPSPMQTT